jgi:hypothetical protein
MRKCDREAAVFNFKHFEVDILDSM